MLSTTLKPRCMRSLGVASLLLLVSGCGLGVDTSQRLERAQTAFDRSEYRTTIIDTRNILQKEPQNREARLLLGKASIRMTDAATAEKELRRAVELGIGMEAVVVDLGNAMLGLRQFEGLLEEIRPELAKNGDDRKAILQLRGDALLELQRFPEAREAYEAVLAVAPDDFQAKLGVVSSFFAERDFSQARSHLDRMLVPGINAAAWLSSASLHLAMQNSAAAEKDYVQGLTSARAQSDRDGEIASLMGLTETRLAQNDLEGAKEALRQLRPLAPEDLRTRYLVARLAYLEQDYELAQTELQLVLAAAPEVLPAQFLMGAVHLRRGNLEQAEMFLSDVLKAQPENLDARKLLAETRLQQHRPDEASQIMRSIAGGANADEASLNLAARASLDADEYQDAIGYLQQALANDPDNVAIALDLAAALLQTGNVTEAEKLLSSPLEGSDSLELRRDSLRVMVLLRNGDTSSALRDARAMADRWPDDADVHNLIARIAASTNQLDVARDHFLKAQQNNPADVSHYRSVAAIDVRRGDLDSARKQFLLALEKQPTSANLLMDMVQLEARAGNPGASHEYLEKATAADPAAIEPRLMLAQSYQNRGETAAAIGQYELLLERAPDNLIALNNLGWAYFESGDSRAEEVARRAYKLAPQNGAVADTLGWIQISNGNLDEGVPMLRKAVDLSGGNNEIRYHLAAGLAAAGEAGEARRILQEALAGNAEFASKLEAEKLLGRL
jgi:cellulose synthase operon protein C